METVLIFRLRSDLSQLTKTKYKTNTPAIVVYFLLIKPFLLNIPVRLLKKLAEAGGPSQANQASRCISKRGIRKKKSEIESTPTQEDQLAFCCLFSHLYNKIQLFIILSIVIICCE